MGKLDLSKLSRDEKLRLFDLLEEQERRKKERRDIYKPNEGQLLVHKSQATERFVFSGNGGGKTCLAVQEILWACEGFNPVTKTFSKVPCRVIVLLDLPSKVTDLWLPEILKWRSLREDQMRQRGKPFVSQITFDNGSEIIFYFHEQNLLSFESIEADFLCMDEPPKKSVFVALKRGLRKKGTKPKILMVGTPISQQWLRTEIFNIWKNGGFPPGEVECFRFGTKVNEKNLADGYIERFSRSLSEKERQIRLEGSFYDIEGLALAHLFDRGVHIIPYFEWDRSNPVVISIDPHPSKNMVACMLGVDRDGYLYYLKELSLKLPARQFAAALKEWYQGYKIVDIVCDSLGSADSTGGEGFKSFIQVLQDCGIRVRATTFEDKSEEAFIERIRDALLIPETPNNFGQCTPKLRIVEGNWGIVSDVENVSWVKHRDHDFNKPKLDLVNTDHLSCLKYALATNLSPSKGKTHSYVMTRPAYGMQAPTARKAKNLTMRFRRK